MENKVAEKKEMMKITDIKEFCNISLNKAYELTKEIGFPKVKFGRDIRTHKNWLVDFLEHKARGGFFVLDLREDPHAVAVLQDYSERIKSLDPAYHNYINDKLKEGRHKQTYIVQNKIVDRLVKR